MPKKKRRVSRPISRSKRIDLPTEATYGASSFNDYIHMYFGMPGIGKTQFVNDMFMKHGKKVLFLSTDRGTRFAKALRWNCNKWQDWEDVLEALEKGDAKKYDAVCIDHVHDWADQGEVAILEKLNIESLTDAGYGKGWSMYKQILQRYVQRLRALDLGVVLIAHEDIKTIKVEGLEVDKVMPKMSKQAWDALIPICDIVGYCGTRVVKRAGKRAEIRTVEFEPKRDMYAKDRTRRMKPKKGYELLDGEAFASTFEVSKRKVSK